MNDSPIGVFDSGLGGLTVLNELVKILPEENFIYLADLKYSPYGDKSEIELEYIIKRVLRYFVEKKVKLIVVACNTASTMDLIKKNQVEDIPIINVIDAAVDLVDEKVENLLLLATKKTTESKTYDEKIKVKNPGINLIKQACPSFVPAIESGKLNDEEIQNLVDQDLKRYRDNKLDAAILGCTHYPLWYDFIRKSLNKEVKIYDPAQSLAQKAKNFLEERNMLRRGDSYKLAVSTDYCGEFNKKSRKILKNYKFDKIEEINIDF